MVRTQVYLTERERSELAALAKATGKKQSELIREAVDRLIEQSIAKRPLFRSEKEARRLWQTRLPHYEECDLRIRIHSDEQASDVAGRVAEQLNTAGV